MFKEKWKLFKKLKKSMRMISFKQKTLIKGNFKKEQNRNPVIEMYNK